MLRLSTEIRTSPMRRRERVNFVKLAPSVFGLALALTAVSTSRAATFAEYSAVSSADNIKWTKSASGLTGVLTSEGAGASANVQFSFLTPALSSLGNLPALMTLQATGGPSDPAQTIPGLGVVVQPNLSGTFSFIYVGSTPLIVNGHSFTQGADLLSGVFSGAAISGFSGAEAGGVSIATGSGGVITYSSDFLTFTPGVASSFGLSVTSAAPPLTVTPGKALDSFEAVSIGSFQGDRITGVGAVPEPATWAMLILGMGAIGAVLRRRSELAFATA